MKTLALVAWLLAAAGPPGDPVPAPGPVDPDPPPARAPVAHGWTPAQRSSVMEGCREALPDEDVCPCLTRQLEVLSGGREVVTTEDIQTGLQRCRTL